MTVQATIVVDFGATGDGFLAAELDSAKNGGRSSFAIGDEVWFRVYSTVPYEVKRTAGGVYKMESNKYETGIQEVISFAYTAVSSVSKLIYNIQNWLPYGISLGTPVALGGADATSVQVPNGGPEEICIGKITYTTKYDLWKLTSPPGLPEDYDDYAILIGIKST